MYRSSRIFLTLFILLAVASLACSLGGKPAATQSPTSTARPAATPLPAASPTPSISLGEEMRLEEQGFAFRPLPAYQLDTRFGVQMLAPGADPDSGPAFMLAGGQAAEGTTAETLIATLENGEVAVSEPRPITVDGRAGLAADVQRTTGDLAGRVIAVMVTPTQQFVLVGMASQAQWEAEIAPLFDALLGSVKLFELSAAPLSPLAPAGPTQAVAPLSEIRQWGSAARASSEYGSSNWAASQATGAPNVTACSDNGKAWAAARSDSLEWLEVSFAVPVEPKQVNVHISYNPTYITRMELLDTSGQYHQIYAFEARPYAECPTVFSVDVSEIGFQAVAVKITLDQATAPSWVEIDAVELVGRGDASQLGALAASPVGPASEGFATPEGFLWRLGGEKAFDAYARFPGLWGMAYDPANRVLFIADALHGVQVIGAEGEHIGAFEHDDMRVPQDVKVDARGNVYVAAWGSGKVLVFPPMGGGEALVSFGERGKGDGQFGDFSPTHLAVGLDGRIYVHDRNQNSKDEYYNRIQVFSPQGAWLQTIQFEDAYFSPAGMDVGPDGNLYVAGFIGSNVLKYSPEGELLAELGEDAIRSLDGGPQGIALDAAGNIYLALWTGGIAKLDPQGELLGQWGVLVKDGENPWPEGGFYQPGGVAVTPDGGTVFFSDTSSKYAYVTAFTFGQAAGASGTSGEAMRVWASAAQASSEDYEHGAYAMQAAGEPDTLACGSNGTAWGPESADSGYEEIVLYYYDVPLVPTQVNIVMSYNPSQVVRVELLDAYGAHPDVVIYEGQPQRAPTCPYTLSIPVTGIDYPVMGIRLVVDQSVLGSGRAEIDAVELVGVPPADFSPSGALPGIQPSAQFLSPLFVCGRANGLRSPRTAHTPRRTGWQDISLRARSGCTHTARGTAGGG